MLTPASTDPECVADRIVDDLRWLARQAAARGLRIAYESMAWSTVDHRVDPQRVIDTARHHRLLPGQGHLPIDTVVDHLCRSSYFGPIGLEVFNDELKAQDPTLVAREAMAALRRVWPQQG